MNSHHDKVISLCNVRQAVVGPDLMDVVGEHRDDQPAGVVARPCPGLVVARVIHIDQHFKGDLILQRRKGVQSIGVQSWISAQRRGFQSFLGPLKSNTTVCCTLFPRLCMAINCWR